MISSISLCMVVYNEGHRIYDTLTAAAPYVDEIVVVDQQSTDNTVDVIHQWWDDNDRNIPTKIVPDKHWGYCEPSRIKAHEASTGSWILVLDADEQVSDEFVKEMRHIDEKGYVGARLKRGLWVGGEHRFTGDYQYRFFRRDSVKYLDEIHTEPQPTVYKTQIYHPAYRGIIHTKSWTEQLRDERAYESLIGENDPRAKEKLSLNVYSRLLEAAGVTPEEADAMTVEEREALGIGAPDWAKEQE